MKGLLYVFVVIGTREWMLHITTLSAIEQVHSAIEEVNCLLLGTI